MFMFLDARDEVNGPSPYYSWWFAFYYILFIIIGNIFKYLNILNDY